MPSPRTDYQRMIQSARDAALALTETQARAFLRLLEEYAEELSVRVATGLASRGERQALAIAEEILTQLTRDMAFATRNGITLTARRVAEIHARATMALIDASGASISVGFGGIGVSAAQAVLARPALAATFRSIRRDSVQAVDRIIRRNLIRSAGADALERELRAHMLGAEVFPSRLLEDRRTIGYRAIQSMGYEPTPANLEAVRADARGVSNRARLIARTELMNAQLEAGKQAAEASPVVGYLRWQTSRRHTKPDQCDALRDVDWYGHGTGVYLPEQLPARPHPRCLCLWTHQLRPVAEWGRPRKAPGPIRVTVADITEDYGFSPSQEASLAAALAAGQPRRQAA